MSPRTDPLAPEQISRRLALAFASTGKSGKDIAKEVGTTQPEVSRWAHGQRLPNSPNMARLVVCLNVNAHWVLTGEGKMR